MNNGTRYPRRPDGALSIRSAYNPWARLAAAVLVQALRDWHIWLTDAAVHYRSLPTAERTRRYARRSQVWRAVAGGPDPGIFLTADTPYHRYLDVDPEQLRALLSNRDAVARIKRLLGRRGGARPGSGLL